MKLSLKEIREVKGIRQEDLAKAVGICVSGYSKYENGETKVPKQIAEKIAKELDVSVEDIFLPSHFTIHKK